MPSLHKPALVNCTKKYSNKAQRQLSQKEERIHVWLGPHRRQSQKEAKARACPLTYAQWPRPVTEPVMLSYRDVTKTNALCRLVVLNDNHIHNIRFRVSATSRHSTSGNRYCYLHKNSSPDTVTLHAFQQSGFVILGPKACKIILKLDEDNTILKGEGWVNSKLLSDSDSNHKRWLMLDKVDEKNWDQCQRASLTSPGRQSGTETDNQRFKTLSCLKMARNKRCISCWKTPRLQQ